MRPLGPGREIAPGTTVLAHLARSNGLDVYDAWNEPRACRVIAKTLRPDRLRSATAVRSLVREGRLLQRLTHPHIVRAYEVHREPRPVVVMETLAGATLDHVIAHGRPLSAPELAHLGSHLASGLCHLHAHGIVHLDLKPPNVIAERGRAKVIDLSHARRPGRVRAGHGRWCYMAPEQARGGLVGPFSSGLAWGVIGRSIGRVGNTSATRRTIRRLTRLRRTGPDSLSCAMRRFLEQRKTECPPCPPPRDSRARRIKQAG